MHLSYFGGRSEIFGFGKITQLSLINSQKVEKF